MLCKALNIPDESEMSVDKILDSLPQLSKVVVDLWKKEDWDILESNQVLIQESMLQQVKVVQENVPLVVFCHNSPIILLPGKLKTA